MHPAILVTGGAGFIGSALVRALLERTAAHVVNVDALTYAGNPESLAEVAPHPRHHFRRVDICDGAALRRIFAEHRPGAVMHLAAHSHVDRSIDGPADFIRANVVGTYTLLEEARRYWSALRGEARDAFRFLHVSTDEVFGSLGATGYFTEAAPYRPSSPYSASKAGSDHLVGAWHRTYGLPTLTTYSSNNYGARQFPEKLIPRMVLNALAGRPLPVYGRGDNVRDWLYVEDHVDALLAVLRGGQVGGAYAVGAGEERTNLEVVLSICRVVDEMAPDPAGAPREGLIRFVKDRPGHDLRYAIDSSRIRSELGWKPAERFETGLRKTVRWYLENRPWWQSILSAAARGERPGLGSAA